MEFSLLSSKELIVVIASYALGCFSTGYYLVRLRTGQDIRELGSGSAGGTNVGRVLGRAGFAVTMFVDLIKGALALGIALYLGVTSWVLTLIITAVVVGHIFPLQLGFRGGKGLATALGAMLMYDFRLPIVISALTLLLGSLSKQFTLSLMLVIAAAPLVAALFGHTSAEAGGVAMTALFILLAHRTNIATALKALWSQTHPSK
ncbi:MAG: glycerol-3-phosphate acyltransferase [Chloroflexota bacterium]|nr:glycerol-3-phosphate acyltransferase [Chloroflexota bacterium]